MSEIPNFDEIGHHSLELFNMFKGLDLNRAIEKAHNYGLLPHISEYDGKSFCSTKAIRSDRINFVFKDGVVVDANIC